MCKGNLSRVSLARSVTRPQATGFALQNRTNTKKDTQKRVFFVLVRPTGFEPAAYRVGVFRRILIKCCIFNGYVVFGENVRLF